MSNGRDNRSTDQRRKALVSAILLSVGLLPVLGGVWFISALWLYFGSGGDFGGYGAAPSDPEPWVKPAQWALLIMALAIDAGAGIRRYKRQV